MIDYDKPDDDPIVAEVRRAREEYAARFNFDLRAIFDNLIREQATSGHEYVSRPSRRPDSPRAKARKAG